MTKIAFLGTGTMGMPMARNLLSGGFELRAWNRSIERARPLTEQGAEVTEDPGQAAAGAEVLITMLSDADAVVSSAEPALEALSEGAIWVQMSTIGPGGTERCIALADRVGVELVDAPVLGTRDPAEQAKLVVLASGAERARPRCEPIFEQLGSRVMWLGERGAGTKAKLVVNAWLLGVVSALAEAIALAEALELDPRILFDAVDGGPLDLPYARIKGEMMIEHAFSDASFKLALARKDAELVLEAAAATNLELPLMDAVTARL